MLWLLDRAYRGTVFFAPKTVAHACVTFLVLLFFSMNQHGYIGGILDEPRVPADCCRRRRRSRSHPLDAVAHLPSGGNGQGSQTRFVALDQNERPGPKAIRLAGRLRHFLDWVFATCGGARVTLPGKRSITARFRFRMSFACCCRSTTSISMSAMYGTDATLSGLVRLGGIRSPRVAAARQPLG